MKPQSIPHPHPSQPPSRQRNPRIPGRDGSWRGHRWRRRGAQASQAPRCKEEGEKATCWDDPCSTQPQGHRAVPGGIPPGSNPSDDDIIYWARRRENFHPFQVTRRGWTRILYPWCCCYVSMFLDLSFYLCDVWSWCKNNVEWAMYVMNQVVYDAMQCMKLVKEKCWMIYLCDESICLWCNLWVNLLSIFVCMNELIWWSWCFKLDMLWFGQMAISCCFRFDLLGFGV